MCPIWPVILPIYVPAGTCASPARPGHPSFSCSILCEILVQRPPRHLAQHSADAATLAAAHMHRLPVRNATTCPLFLWRTARFVVMLKSIRIPLMMQTTQEGYMLSETEFEHMVTVLDRQTRLALAHAACIMLALSPELSPKDAVADASQVFLAVFKGREKKE